MIRRALASCLLIAALATGAQAQTARSLFAAKSTPSPHPSYSIGQPREAWPTE